MFTGSIATSNASEPHFGRKCSFIYRHFGEVEKLVCVCYHTVFELKDILQDWEAISFD